MSVQMHFFISNLKIIICVQAYTFVAKIKVISILLKVWSKQKAGILYRLNREPLLNEIGWCMHASENYVKKVQIMLCCLNGAKPLSEPVNQCLHVVKRTPRDKLNEIEIQMRSFSLKILYCINIVCKTLGHFDSVSVCQSTWYGYSSKCSSKFLAWSVRHQLCIFFLNKFRSFTFLT